MIAPAEREHAAKMLVQAAAWLLDHTSTTRRDAAAMALIAGALIELARGDRGEVVRAAAVAFVRELAERKA